MSPEAIPSHTAQLQALGELVVALTESRSIGRILSLVGEKLKSLFDADVVQVWIIGEDKKELYLVLTIVDDEHRLAPVLAECKIEDLATSSFTSAESVRLRRLVVRRAGDKLPGRVAEIMAAGQVEMTMSSPILARGEVHGAINLMLRRAIELSLDDIRFLDVVGRVVATAMETGRLMDADHGLRAALADSETSSRRLEEANRHLLEAMRVKDEFLSTLSHELRTPLTPVLGWTRILKSQGVDEGLLDQGVRAIERNVMVQVRLVDDLLDLSRVAHDKIRLSLERVELVTTLRNAWEEVRPDAEAKEIRLETDFPPEPIMIEGDKLRLRQIFTNLMTNSVKFSEEGGRVQLIARRAGDRVEVQVADDGIGIEADFLPRVFERFQQADSIATRRHGGLGIGLSIAKSMTEMHGGTIHVESAGLGHGARFRLSFPAAEAHVPAAEEQVPLASPGLSGLRVLLADDEADTLEALRYVLELEGASVITAESGRDAIELALECLPDVLLCDLEMTDIEGFEVAARLRAMPETAAIRQVALSDHGGELNLERARQAGFDEHLLKPVVAETLVSAIRRVVRRS